MVSGSGSGAAAVDAVAAGANDDESVAPVGQGALSNGEGGELRPGVSGSGPAGAKCIDTLAGRASVLIRRVWPWSAPTLRKLFLPLLLLLLFVSPWNRCLGSSGSSGMGDEDRDPAGLMDGVAGRDASGVRGGGGDMRVTVGESHGNESI